MTTEGVETTINSPTLQLPGGSLFQFQDDGLYYLLEHEGKAIIGDDRGLGKSVTALAWAFFNPHLRPVVCVTPATIKNQWSQFITHWLGVDPADIQIIKGVQPQDITATWNIVNYDILSNHLPALTRLKPKLVIYDECLPYNSPIITNVGTFPIGLIVEHQLPVLVLSCELSTGTLEWKKITNYIKNPLREPLVKVTHQGGSFICTWNHKIWTQEQGYVPSIALQNGTNLCLVQQPIQDKQKRTEYCSLLFPFMCNAVLLQPARCTRVSIHSPVQTTSIKDLRTLWTRISFPLCWPNQQQKEILLQALQCSLSFNTTRLERRLGETKNLSPSWYQREENASILRAYEAQQSYETTRGQGKTTTFNVWSHFFVQGGEWGNNQTTGSIDEIHRFNSRISDHYINSTTYHQAPSNFIQGRPGRPSDPDCNRSRRWNTSLFQETEISRPEKRGSFGYSRVVSIEVLEQTNRRESVRNSNVYQNVYCLEVEDNHNFFADSILVSNCHRIKNKTAIRSKAALRLARLPSVESRIGLTGTTFRHRPLDGLNQVQIINPFVFPSETKYKHDFCNPQLVNTKAKRDKDGNVQKNDKGDVIWHKAWDYKGASNLDRLNQVLRDRVLIRRTKEEVFPELPKLQRVTVPLECDLTRYDRVKKQVREELKRIRAILKDRRQGWEKLTGAEREALIAQDAEKDSLIRLYGLAGGEIAKLRQEAGLAKVDLVSDWLEDFISEGNSVLLFGHHHAVLDRLVHALNHKPASLYVDWSPEKAVLSEIMGDQSQASNPLDKGLEIVPPPLDGRMAPRTRERYAEAFTQRKTPVLTAGLYTMSEGFDGLQRACSNVAFLELGWSETDHDQAEGRLDRTGQTLPVNSYYLIAQHTIDESLARVVDAKGTVTSAAYGEDPPIGVLEALMDELIGAEE